MIDSDCKDRDLLALIKYIAAEDKLEKILENQIVLKQPIVRNGKQATVGYRPEVWKEWKYNKRCYHSRSRPSKSRPAFFACSC